MKHPWTALTLIVLVSFVAMLSDCQEKFIPDPTDSRLPEYTTDGNEVAGVLINDIAWKTHWYNGLDGHNRAFYFRSATTGDSIVIRMEGNLNEGVNKGALLNFTVVLKGQSLSKTEDLQQLGVRTFTMNGLSNYVLLDDYGETLVDSVQQHRAGTGTFMIKSIKAESNTTLTRTNGTTYHPLIVSGTFDFTFEKYSVKVTSGRYDFMINDNYIDIY